MADAPPDVVVGCTGSGSNFAGIAFPFIGHGLRGGPAAHRGRGAAVCPRSRAASTPTTTAIPAI